MSVVVCMEAVLARRADALMARIKEDAQPLTTRGAAFRALQQVLRSPLLDADTRWRIALFLGDV